MGAVASRSCVFENVVLKLLLALSATTLVEGTAKDSNTSISMGAVASLLVIKLRLALSATILGEGKAKDSDTCISSVGIIT